MKDDEAHIRSFCRRLESLSGKMGEYAQRYVDLVILGLKNNYSHDDMKSIARNGESLVQKLKNPDDELDNYCVQAAVYCIQIPYKDGADYYADRWLRYAEEAQT